MKEGTKPYIAERFTIPGILLIMAFTVGFVLLLLRYLNGAIESLPPGTYPLFVFVVPVLIVAFLAFLLTAAILEKIGIRIYKEPNQKK